MSDVSYIIVNIDQQRLYCFDHNDKKKLDYPVSTSKFGVGSQNGCFKTPLGWHSIAQKIGGGCAINEVFVGRQPIGILADLMAGDETLPEDIISSRILWLQGEEVGINKPENKGINNEVGDAEITDSYQRYIYIHGTSEETKIGSPASHGCVRMCNKDIIELFDRVDEGCKVLIQQSEDTSGKENE